MRVDGGVVMPLTGGIKENIHRLHSRQYTDENQVKTIT
jgi:hypothetical protein